MERPVSQGMSLRYMRQATESSRIAPILIWIQMFALFDFNSLAIVVESSSP